MNRIWLYDTTLRDGAQSEHVAFTVADKLEIVGLLDSLGVDYIEGGWPGSNVKDLAFFYELGRVSLQHSRVAAFTSTRKKGQRIEEDGHMNMVLGTGMRYCAVVGKTWDFHVLKALRTELDENLRMIADTVSFLKRHEIEVTFDAEHFFDAYKRNPQYAIQSLAAARDAGADWLVLCDTNGGALPHEVQTIVAEVRAAGFTPLGIHTHNDGGLAVANALSAVEAGAVQVQTTINGLGERCGNADLCAVAPNLIYKLKRPCHMGVDGLRRLKEVSDRLYAITERSPVGSQPFVGESAFAHKAGMHVSAVMRDPSLYEHMPPQMTGNQRRVLVSELSGASNIRYQLERMGLPASEEDAGRILARVKATEALGYVYENAHTSLELLMLEELGLTDGSVGGYGGNRVDDSAGGSVDNRVGGHAGNRGGGRVAAHASTPAPTAASASEPTTAPPYGSGEIHHASSSEYQNVIANLSAAMDLKRFSFLLGEHRVSSFSRTGQDHRHRAVVTGLWEHTTLCTMGIGTTAKDALADALAQISRYLHHMQLTETGKPI
ncbi:MAG: citramalate synthase [Bacilli bacterium]